MADMSPNREPAPPNRSHPANLPALHRALGIPANYATTRGLAPSDEAPEDALVALDGDGVPHKIRLTIPAAAAWRGLHAAARDAGVTLLPLSGFRSVARQTEIIRAKLANGRAIEEILRSSAAPGYSEHHSGRAIDIGTPGSLPLEEEFDRTPAFAWLSRHAGMFGFAMSYPRNNPHGIIYEPWHWCWHAPAGAPGRPLPAAYL